MRASITACWARVAAPFSEACGACHRSGVGPLCEHCLAASAVAGSPHRTSLARRPLWFVAAYWQPGSHAPSPVANALVRFKHAGDRYAGRRLANRFAAALTPVAASFDVLVPIPPSPQRLRRRGLDPAAWLARALARASHRPLDYRLLSRREATVPQRGLTGAARRTNVRGAFEAGAKTDGIAVLLIDDVLTTGSTLSEAAATLERAGAADIGLAVLACADKELCWRCLWKTA